MKYNKIEKLFESLKVPEALSDESQIVPIKTVYKSIDVVARLKCFNCGLYCRAILCPPYLFQTYPQFKSYKSTKEWIKTFDAAILFIWKNDGSKSWTIDPGKLSHLELKPKFGKQLKGTETSQSREMCRLTAKYRAIARKTFSEAFGLINGHCDLCAFKCPNRDNPPCKKGGMPSLEAIGIDVYRLYTMLGIEYEYPVETYLTLSTMLLIKE